MADSLGALVRKGEVKRRYLNPNDFFGEIQVLDPGATPVDPEAVRLMAGSAGLEIVPSGWASHISRLTYLSLRPFLEKSLAAVLPAVSRFGPDAVRAYNPQISGWLAVRCAGALGVPAVISLHADYDRDVRVLQFQDRRLREFAANLILGVVVEREALREATLVICAYEFPVRYARRHGARRVEVVYNRVDLKRFSPPRASDGRGFTVLTVGRLDQDKDPSSIVRAMAAVDGRLRIVGDGTLTEQLRRLAREANVSDRVSFLRSVPHERIHEEYQRADVYATAYRLGGVSIPILEAMACALPVVAARSRWDAEVEIVSEVGLVVENRPDAFATALGRLRHDAELRDRLGALGRARIESMSGAAMEAREADLYRELVGRG